MSSWSQRVLDAIRGFQRNHVGSDSDGWAWFLPSFVDLVLLLSGTPRGAAEVLRDDGLRFGIPVPSPRPAFEHTTRGRGGRSLTVRFHVSEKGKHDLHGGLQNIVETIAEDLDEAIAAYDRSRKVSVPEPEVGGVSRLVSDAVAAAWVRRAAQPLTVLETIAAAMLAKSSTEPAGVVADLARLGFFTFFRAPLVGDHVGGSARCHEVRLLASPKQRARLDAATATEAHEVRMLQSSGAAAEVLDEPLTSGVLVVDDFAERTDGTPRERAVREAWRQVRVGPVRANYAAYVPIHVGGVPWIVVGIPAATFDDVLNVYTEVLTVVPSWLRAAAHEVYLDVLAALLRHAIELPEPPRERLRAVNQLWAEACRAMPFPRVQLVDPWREVAPGTIEERPPADALDVPGVGRCGLAITEESPHFARQNSSGVLTANDLRRGVREIVGEAEGWWQRTLQSAATISGHHLSNWAREVSLAPLLRRIESAPGLDSATRDEMVSVTSGLQFELGAMRAFGAIQQRARDLSKGAFPRRWLASAYRGARATSGPLVLDAAAWRVIAISAVRTLVARRCEGDGVPGAITVVERGSGTDAVAGLLRPLGTRLPPPAPFCGDEDLEGAVAREIVLLPIVELTRNAVKRVSSGLGDLSALLGSSAVPLHVGLSVDEASIHFRISNPTLPDEVPDRRGAGRKPPTLDTIRAFLRPFGDAFRIDDATPSDAPSPELGAVRWMTGTYHFHLNALRFTDAH